MVFLAERAGGGPVTKYEIAEHEALSANYVEQIMIQLKSAHLVHSHRGRHGGFSLARDADRITLREVLDVMEGPVSPAPCLHADCDRTKVCPTRPMWMRAAAALNEIFEGATIGSMLRESPGRTVGAGE